MTIYGLASLPLIHKLNIERKLDRHRWFADDCGAGATFNNLRKDFDLISIFIYDTSCVES